MRLPTMQCSVDLDEKPRKDVQFMTHHIIAKPPGRVTAGGFPSLQAKD